jgi:hypothetical protein
MTTLDVDAIAVPHDGSRLDQWSVASQFAVNLLDGFHGKMTANCQRALLGAVPFGRKTIIIDCDGCGSVRLTWRSSCGTDTLFIDMTFAELANRINPPENAKLINIL